MCAIYLTILITLFGLIFAGLIFAKLIFAIDRPNFILFAETNLCDWQKMEDFAGLIFAVEKKWKFSSSEMKIIFC